MGKRHRAAKLKPVPLTAEQEFRHGMEGLEGEPDEVAIVSIDLRRIIPAKQPGGGYEHQRAVVKAAEQIHARMMIMGKETRDWHELGIDAYDSYCIAAYAALNAGLQCGIAFVPQD